MTANLSTFSAKSVSLDSMLLECRQVMKRYGHKTAVNNISFTIPRGGTCGLLGPNGAGKTTLIRMIMDILKPDAGTIHLGDLFNSRTRKNFIGYLPEERGLYLKEQVDDTLIYFAMLKGLTRKQARVNVSFYLDRLQMDQTAGMKIHKLSKGNQQKIQLISAIASHPKLLILDEPFSGLDPVNVHLVMEMLDELQEQGLTIILSTHQMNKVESFCRKVLLVNNGTLVLNEAMDSLIARYSGDYYVVEGKAPLQNSELFTVHEVNGPLSKIKLKDAVSFKDLLTWLGNSELSITAVTPYRMSLSDIFIAEVQKKQEVR